MRFAVVDVWVPLAVLQSSNNLTYTVLLIFTSLFDFLRCLCQIFLFIPVSVIRQLLSTSTSDSGSSVALPY